MELLRQARPEDAAAHAASQRAGTRALTARLWDADETVRNAAAEAIGHLSTHDPSAVVETLRRFVWALNDESGTNAAAVLPAVTAVARVKPELLAPFLGALVAHLDDDGLRPELVTMLETLERSAPTLLDDHDDTIVTAAEQVRTDARLEAIAARRARGETQ